MAEAVDYYHVLDLQPEASPEQIKSAYRRLAKILHPDAGGSPEAMELVNEAHRTLSDPDLRQQYDAARNAPHPDPEAVRTTVQIDEGEARQRLYRQIRLAAARHNAWLMVKNSLKFSILLSILAVFFISQTSALQSKLLIALVSAVPIYATVMGLIFLINPQLRLDIHDLGDDLLHRRNPLHYFTKAELYTLLGLALLVIPIILIWAVILITTVHL